MSLNFMAVISRATYIRYIGVSKMMIKNHGELPFLGKLGKDVPAAKLLRLRQVRTQAFTYLLRRTSS